MDAIKRFILHASKSIFVAFADVSIQHQYSIASHVIKDISCVFIHILHIFATFQFIIPERAHLADPCVFFSCFHVKMTCVFCLAKGKKLNTASM